MKLDPKYFNSFLAVVAVVAAAIIIFFTINSQESKRAAFKRRIVQQDSLKAVPWTTIESSDSLRIEDFKDQYVLLQFWSNWMDNPELIHRKLVKLQDASKAKLAILSAMVGFKREEAVGYVEQQNLPIAFVVGSTQFSSFGVPGVPAYLLFSPENEISFISFGELNKSQLDSLRSLVAGGRP
ncbi:MAG TPA: hypothetical protein VK112_11025 [Fodinibius sp.]|nr:hypothetical protein [Fodinibius sp.]